MEEVVKPTCSVITCKATSTIYPGLKLYNFPDIESRCKLWAKAAGRPELMDHSVEHLNKNYYICNMHFARSDRLFPRMKLKDCAIPTLNLAPYINENPSKSVQTYELDIITCKRVLPDDGQDVNKRRTTGSLNAEAQIVNLIKLHKQLQLRQSYSKIKNVNDNEMLEWFALIAYLTAPQTYSVVHQLLELPSARRLQKIDIGIRTKLNTNTIKCLETKVKNRKRYEKQCIVCAQKVDLKTNLFYEISKDRIVGFNEINDVQTMEPTTHAIVLVARGIFSDWEQPLNYCFLSKDKHDEELLEWLYETLTKVMEIGLNVTAFISGQEKIFTDIASILLVTEENPFFLVNEKKMYYIYDFSDLLMSLRNNMMEYNFVFQDTHGKRLIATWEDLRMLYAEDSKRKYRLAPELTAAHINPNKSEKMKSEYVTQVFNETVVAAMTASKELQEKGIGTIKLIELVSDALDELNSTLPLSASAAKSNGLNALKEFLKFLNNATVQERNINNDVKNSVKCLEHLRISVKSIIAISNDLRLKGFKALPINKINRNTAHKFIDSIKGKNSKRPTPINFVRAYRSFFMKKLMEKSNETKTTDGIDRLLSMDVNNVMVSLTPRVARSLVVSTTDYRINLPEEHALVYASGYFLQKVFAIHKCQNVLRYLQKPSDYNNYPEYQKAFANLEQVPIPPETFIHLIDKLDKIFIRCFQNKRIEFIGNDINKLMEHVTFDLCCNDFPMEYLRKLFIRFRLFNIIRTNNKNFGDALFQWKCFCVYDM